MSELSWETLADVVKKIAMKAGEKEVFTEDGKTGTIWTYEDPWGGGLMLRYGIMGDSGPGVYRPIISQQGSSSWMLYVRMVGCTFSPTIGLRLGICIYMHARLMS